MDIDHTCPANPNAITIGYGIGVAEPTRFLDIIMMSEGRDYKLSDFLAMDDAEFEHHKDQFTMNTCTDIQAALAWENLSLMRRLKKLKNNYQAILDENKKVADRLSLVETEVKYRPGGLGFTEAKAHFEQVQKIDKMV